MSRTPIFIDQKLTPEYVASVRSSLWEDSEDSDSESDASINVMLEDGLALSENESDSEIGVEVGEERVGGEEKNTGIDGDAVQSDSGEHSEDGGDGGWETEEEWDGEWDGECETDEDGIALRFCE
jgi:hypothetical protein